MLRMKHTILCLGAACAVLAAACEREGVAVGSATATGATIETGALGSGQPCEGNGQCRSGFCERPLGKCEARGVCTHVPACTSTGADDDTRMCGCDGTTYGAECDAEEHRMSLLKPGPCG
jgi:hypothetical protein